MAKQANESKPDAQRTNIYPDPDKDALVLRYPLDGSVKVVGGLSFDKDKRSLSFVEPQTKNAAAFMQITDSRLVARFFTEERIEAYRQSKDTRAVPELYRVPFDKVGTLAESLLKLQLDPKDDEALAAARKYRTSTTTLNKILYDKARMPLQELTAAGFDVAQMEKDGLIRSMELGKETPLITLSHKLGDHLPVEGLYSLRPQYDEHGDMHFHVSSPLPMPEFYKDENLRMELNGEEMTALRAGKTLDRMLRHDGEYCYAALSRVTNRMIYVPKKDVIVPNFLYNVALNPAQMEELGRGGRALLEDCHYQGDSNTFKGHAQFDVHRMDFVVSDPHYSQIYIPEHIDRQLDSTMREALYNFEMVDGRRIKTRDGRTMNCNLQVNRETLGLEYIDYRRVREMQAQQASKAAAQEQTQAPSVVAEQEPTLGQEPMPEIPPMTPEDVSQAPHRSQGPRM